MIMTIGTLKELLAGHDNSREVVVKIPIPPGADPAFPEGSCFYSSIDGVVEDVVEDGVEPLVLIV